MTNRDTVISKAVALVAKEFQKVYDEAIEANVTRCIDCIHWEPENAEEGDYGGHCRNPLRCMQ